MLTVRAPHVPASHLAAHARTLGDLLRRRAAANPERPAFFQKSAGQWTPTSWRGFYRLAAQTAAGLKALGLSRGERIAIIGPTQPAWGEYDMGAQLLGLCSLGVYPQQTVEQVAYLLVHSDTRVVFVGEAAEIERVVAASRDLQSVIAIVPWTEALFESTRHLDPRIVSPSLFRKEPLPEAELVALDATINPEDTAILIYTSGTTGPPKGAMISHRNILSLLGCATDFQEMFEDDITLSFLPMAHAAERVLSFYGRISTGVTSAYASSIGAVLTEIREVAPTIFGSVPRIFEKAYAKIHSELEQKPVAVQRIFAWAKSVGQRRAQLLLQNRPIPLPLALQYRVSERLVWDKIRSFFGGRLRYCIVGAAPTPAPVIELFWAAGLPIFELYGMTEATVITHANRPGATRLGTVGQVIAPMQQRLADDGEILLRGPWVFQGYYKNPEATAQTIIDGWLHTGDVGTIDSDGFLRITDRKKHLIITAGGKNLAPGNIEAALKAQDSLISQVVAHGDRRNFVSALIAPSPLETLEWGQQRGLVTAEEVKARTQELMQNPQGRTDALNQAMARVVAHPDFQARMQAAVRRGNEQLAHVEWVRRFVLLDRDFSQEHGEMTPSMKVRRKEIEKKYADLLEYVYNPNAEARPEHANRILNVD